MAINIERLRQLAQLPGDKEALAWLHSAGPGRDCTLGTLSNAASLELVNELYGRAAEQVLVLEIEKYTWGENAGKLLVKLPSAPELRSEIFAWNSHWAESLGFDSTPDEGQPYLFLMLD